MVDLIKGFTTPDATSAEVTAARSAYDALTASQQDLVTNYATLTAEEAKLASIEAKKVADAKAALTLGDTSAVTADLTLPTAPTGVSFTWKSSNATVLTDAGAIGTQPTYTEGDATVTLTATIASTTDTNVKDTKVFTVVVKAAAATPLELAVEAVNTATTAAEMRTALEDSNLGLDLATKYSGLVSGQKDMVAQDVLNNRPAAGYADKAAIQAALDAAM